MGWRGKATDRAQRPRYSGERRVTYAGAYRVWREQTGARAAHEIPEILVTCYFRRRRLGPNPPTDSILDQIRGLENHED